MSRVCAVSLSLSLPLQSNFTPKLYIDRYIYYILLPLYRPSTCLIRTISKSKITNSHPLLYIVSVLLQVSVCIRNIPSVLDG